MSADKDADAFEKAEKRLYEWGAACRQNSTELSLPTTSTIARMIVYVQAQTAHIEEQIKLQKQAIRKKLSKVRKVWKEGDPPIDTKLIAESLGYAAHSLTAQGKEKKAQDAILSDMQLDSQSMQVDAVVSRLPNWAKKCIDRSYRFGQKDRHAAEELRMRVGEYSQRRRAAVEQFAIKLKQRYIQHV